MSIPLILEEDIICNGNPVHTSLKIEVRNLVLSLSDNDEHSHFIAEFSGGCEAASL